MACMRRSLPVPVFRYRLAAVFEVFIFGIGSSLGFGGCSGGRQRRSRRHGGGAPGGGGGGGPREARAAVPPRAVHAWRRPGPACPEQGPSSCCDRRGGRGSRPSR